MTELATHKICIDIAERLANQSFAVDFIHSLRSLFSTLTPCLCIIKLIGYYKNFLYQMHTKAYLMNARLWVRIFTFRLCFLFISVVASAARLPYVRTLFIVDSVRLIMSTANTFSNSKERKNSKKSHAIIFASTFMNTYYFPLHTAFHQCFFCFCFRFLIFLLSALVFLFH